MSDLERAEESRERNEGFAYEDYHERAQAYEVDDPKHPDYHDYMADLADLSEPSEQVGES